MLRRMLLFAALLAVLSTAACSQPAEEEAPVMEEPAAPVSEAEPRLAAGLSEEEASGLDAAGLSDQADTGRYNQWGISFAVPEGWAVNESRLPVLMLLPEGAEGRPASINVMRQTVAAETPDAQDYLEKMTQALTEEEVSLLAPPQLYEGLAYPAVQFELERGGYRQLQVHILAPQVLLTCNYLAEEEFFDTYRSAAEEFFATVDVGDGMEYSDMMGGYGGSYNGGYAGGAIAVFG